LVIIEVVGGKKWRVESGEWKEDSLEVVSFSISAISSFPLLRRGVHRTGWDFL